MARPGDKSEKAAAAPPAPFPSGETLRQRYLTRWSQLKNDRSTWDQHWREISDYFQPRRSRWLVQDANQGRKRNDKIINLSPLRALRIMASGMMAGITSPARKWFKLSTRIPALEHSDVVRSWLNAVEDEMFAVFAKSNTYAGLVLDYLDIGAFGTTALYLEEDDEDVVRAYVFPLGSYCLDNSDRLRVDVCYREFGMTVRQLVKKFGFENCSLAVQQLYRERKLGAWRKVLHVIEPNEDADPRFIDNRHMPYLSVWLELEGPTGSEEDKVLRRSGYESFPVMAPRWSTTGEDVYGHSPAMDALGDAKALQTYEMEKAKAVAKMVTPSMKGPTSLRNARVSMVAGDMTYVDETAQGRYEPAYLIDPNGVRFLGEEINRHEQRVMQAMFADLFLMFFESDRREITAEEIRARQQEKMLQLGPVLERLNDELLDPLVDRTFQIMLRRGLIPPVPKELRGQTLRVEYISILAQAQKMLGTTAVEQLVRFIQVLAQSVPDALDNLATDRLIQRYATMLGVSPEDLKSAEEMAALRQQRAQQAAQAQQAQMAMMASQGAKNLGQAPVAPDNALGQLMGTLGPAAAAAVPEGQG